MSDSPSSRSPAEISEAELEYRSVDPWAVTAALLGVASVLALVHPMLWLIPPVGFLAALLALGSLKRNPEHAGRPAALVGLGLSVLFGVTPIAQTISSTLLLSRQSQPIAEEFFGYLRQQSPEKAL